MKYRCLISSSVRHSSRFSFHSLSAASNLSSSRMNSLIVGPGFMVVVMIERRFGFGFDLVYTTLTGTVATTRRINHHTLTLDPPPHRFPTTTMSKPLNHEPRLHHLATTVHRRLQARKPWCLCRKLSTCGRDRIDRWRSPVVSSCDLEC
jgi:hypothetical protein